MDFQYKAANQVIQKNLISQWDGIAKARNLQQRSGLDLSFEHVLAPCIFDLSSDCDWTLVLDAGCGTGVLTERLAKNSNKVVGVDMSPESISIANSSNKKPSNAHYVNCTIEKFSYQEKFSLVIANMLLQDASDFADTVKAINQSLKPLGHLVLTITHPCFWPKYWNYEDESWFSYSQEVAIEAPFRISSNDSPIGLTTHFHRPLSNYITTFMKCGFKIINFIEPYPSPEIHSKYPKPWGYPRFLALKLIKTN